MLTYLCEEDNIKPCLKFITGELQTADFAGRADVKRYLNLGSITISKLNLLRCRRFAIDQSFYSEVHFWDPVQTFVAIS